DTKKDPDVKKDPDIKKDPDVIVKKDPDVKKNPDLKKDPIIKKDPSQPTVKWTDTTGANYAYNFTYKKTKLDTEAADFKQLIDQIVSELNTKGSVKIYIASCASTVPVGGSYKSNSELALARGTQTEIIIRAALKARGVDLKTAKIKFTMNYKTAGPDYRNDYIENRSEYEKWQYVKVYLLPYDKMMSPKGK
ncbi:MAG: hypothetical protein AB1458_16405, partial [Bacteroidota bacterium]